MMRFDKVFDLHGEVALITGGGSGIGLAMASCLHAAGARVVLVGRREPELMDACAGLGEGASYQVHDITKFDGAAALVEKVEQDVGPVSYLLNNAGIHVKKPAVDTSVEEFQRVLETHVLGAHALTRAVVPGMIKRRGGSILFTASMASLFGIPQVVAYSAAKSAQLGMVRTLATELSPHGVRVNAIAPGWIETEMSSKALAGDPVRRDKILGRTPMAKLGQAEDIGWAAVFLSSQAARFITGVVLPVDGGVSIGF
ncbi:MAG: SDR family NAD(P)-dependent oxidoreductase [Opitutales bacterium]|nr:SDR family NAD(P)-dependent oxidoreductase [Opitutales bacterium]